MPRASRSKGMFKERSHPPTQTAHSEQSDHTLEAPRRGALHGGDGVQCCPFAQYMACDSSTGTLDCAGLRFFVYFPDGINQHSTPSLWFGQDFWCHHCRTMKFERATAIVFGRAVGGWNDRRLLLHLNASVAAHPRVYLAVEHNWPIQGLIKVACGAFTRGAAGHVKMARCDQGYRDGSIHDLPGRNHTIPPQTRYIATEGHFWYRDSLDALSSVAEPHIPAEEDACYVSDSFVTTPEVIAVPYQGTLPRVPVGRLGVATRQYRVHYHAGIHGRAAALRRRLYKLCAGQPSWFCGNASTFLNFDAYAQSLQRSDFCFAPTGDSPSRATLFYAIRNGCVPVFFASCTLNYNLDGYVDFLPPASSNRGGFGPRGWALLVNQTAVMLDDKHLTQALAAVTPQALGAMRALGLSYARRTAWTSGGRHEGGDSPSATDVLVARMLGLQAPPASQYTAL